ncbi:discoidin domain-containing protein [Zhouia sp. PK063]|uniref:discoidin domain-containing protein n=1 Tax=Zhouia sp. PK063 TaxID=3373602 RepID=UPI0037A8C5F2
MMKNTFKYLLGGLVFCSVLSCVNDMETKDENLVKIQQSQDQNSSFTYTRNGYTLNFIDESSNSNYQTRLKLINTFFEVYENENLFFNFDSPTEVTVKLSDNQTETFSVSESSVTLNAAQFLDNPFDIDILTAALMQLTGNLTQKQLPDWLLNGISDYGRYKFGLYNNDADWSLPEYEDGQFYTDGNQIVARFIVWIELNFDTTFTKNMVTYLQNNEYNEQEWNTLTGKSLEDLWTLYEEKNNIIVAIGEPIDWTSEASISVSKDNDGGPSANEGSLKLIDGDLSTKMYMSGYTSDFWMQQTLKASRLLNKYELTSGNDSPDRDPKSWTLMGSNNGSDWTEIDAQNNQSFPNRNTTYSYTFSTDQAYQYYRLNITQNNGSSSFQLSEWRLIYVE